MNYYVNTVKLIGKVCSYKSEEGKHGPADRFWDFKSLKEVTLGYCWTVKVCDSFILMQATI